MTVGELRALLERRAQEAEAVQATAPVAAVYRAVLGHLDDLDGVSDREAPREPDHLLTVAQAAERLGVAPKWLYVHADRLPFTRRLGRRALRFSVHGLERWLTRQAAAGTPNGTRRHQDPAQPGDRGPTGQRGTPAADLGAWRQRTAA